jgi:hypothetical protein
VRPAEASIVYDLDGGGESGGARGVVPGTYHWNRGRRPGFEEPRSTFVAPLGTHWGASVR